MSFLDAFRRRQREPWDERLPSGVSAINVGIPEWQRRQLGLDLPPEIPSGDINAPRVNLRDAALDQQPQWTGGGFVSGGPGYRDLPVQQSPSRQDLGTFPTGDSNYDPRRLEQTRPRTTSPFVDRLMQGQRPRVVDPAQAQMLTPEEQQTTGRQRINDRPQFDVDYLNELQDKKLGTKGKIGMALQNIATNLGYQPLPTGRQRDIARAQGRLGQDVMLENQRLKRQGMQSQMDAREANIAAGQERLQQGQTRLDQQRQRDEDAQLLRYYNGRTDFDPEDPAEAAFVARWQQRFGYKPAKNVRGSQLATVTGYDAQGNPMVSIINKGKGTATTATGAIPTTTEGQLNRQQRERQFSQRQQQQQQQFQQREGRLGQTGTQGRKVSPAERKDMAETAAVINQVHRKLSALDDQIKNEKDPDKLRGLQNRRKDLVEEGALNADKMNRIDPDNEWGSGTGGYPYTKPRAQATPSAPASPYAGKSWSLGKWNSAHPNATAEERAAAVAKARNAQMNVID